MTISQPSPISPYVFAGLSKPKEELEADALMLKVCKHFNISVDMLRSKSRESNIVKARCYYIHILTQFNSVPLKRIGDSISRDHSSIIHLRDKFLSELEIYEDDRLPYKKFLEGLNWGWAMSIK
jgi:chromosomal replication initiation ATPase DnaA